MRKYVVGIVIGVLLASAFPVSAAVSTLVGKKITNEYKITVDGQDIGIKAIVVDGISYTPNRAIVEAMGGDVKFQNKTVVVTTEKAQASGGGSVSEPNNSDISKQLIQLQKEIDTQKKEIVMAELKLSQSPNDQELLELVNKLKSQLAELEQRKSELEAQN